MTISTEVRKAGPFVGNDTAASFPFSFKVFKAADLVVVQRVTAADADVVLELGTDYSVVLNADQNATPGGVVTLTAGPLPTGKSLVLSSALLYLQPTDFTNQGGFYPRVISDALDRLTIFCQQLKTTLDLSLSLPITTPPGVSTALPFPEANKVIGWDSAAENLVNIAPASIIGDIAYGTAKADLFVGNGSNTVFTLSADPASQANLDVSVNGVTQRPGIDYTWTGGNNVTFVTAPPVPSVAGIANVLVRHMQALPFGTVSADNVIFRPGDSTDPHYSALYDILGSFRDVRDYGADPTGVHLSDDAFEAAFGDPSGATPCCVWMGVPQGKGKAIYRLSKLTWMSIRKQLRGPGSDLVEVVIDNATAGSVPRAIVGDAYSHASGFYLRNAQPAISRSALVSNSQAVTNGWRDGSLYDIVVDGFDYGIDGWDGLTLGLMFSNTYEKLTFKNYKKAIRCGAGSNNNKYRFLTFLGGEIPFHFNNCTDMSVEHCAWEGHTGFDAIIEASSSMNFSHCYYEPSNGIQSVASHGNMLNVKMTNQTVANFLTATSGSHWSIDNIFDENAAGAATPGAQAWYIADAGSTVRLFDGFVGASGVKTQRNGENGYVQDCLRSVTGWYIQKFANGELEMHYNSEAASDPVMAGAVGTFERALSPPVAFVGLPAVQVGIYANAANSFLLQENPVITARSRVDGTVGIAAKRSGTTFADGYYFHLSIRGRWR